MRCRDPRSRLGRRRRERSEAALIGRGEIWVARLNPNQGAEVGALRPVVVIQAGDRLLRDCYAMAERRALGLL